MEIQAIDDAVFHFVRIGQNVALVEANDLAEVVDAGLIAVDRVRFDRVLQHAAEGLVVEDARQRRRSELE